MSLIDDSTELFARFDSKKWPFADHLVVQTGSINSGALEDTREDDGDRLVLNEINGSDPGFEYDFHFEGIPAINCLEVRLNGYYKGHPQDNVKARLYNFDTLNWDDLTTDPTDFPTRNSDATYGFLAQPAKPYIDAGELRLKIIHTSTGHANNYFYIDQLFLGDDCGSRCLHAEFLLRQEDEDLLAGFEVGQDSADLEARLAARHSASGDQFAKAEIINADSATRFGKLKVRHFSSRALFLKARLMVHFSGTPRRIFSKFVLTRPAEELKGIFTVRQIKTRDLVTELVIRHTAPARTIFAKFDARFFFVEGWGSAKALLAIRHSASATGPKAEFIVKNIGAADAPGLLTVRHTASVNLEGIARLRRSASVMGPRGIAEIRQSTAIARIGEFKIRRSTSLAGPKGVFIVQHWRDLKAAVTVKHSTAAALKARFYTRFLTRLWTNRRYLNGVVDMSEIDVGDAILEYAIEGVMEDVQGELEVNNIDYSMWTDIRLVPVLIRRTVTYGTVAALYARKSKTFKSRVIPSVAPVTVTVIGDEQLAMQHWEKKRDKVLNDYLTNISVDRVLVSTADQEPVFSSDLRDIPPEVTPETSWHEWQRQRNR